MSLPRLSRQMVLETQVRMPDGAGGHTTTWSALGTVFADVKAGTGRQVTDLTAAMSRMTCRVIVRAAPIGAPSRPQPGQRFREGSRIYRVDAVSPYDRGGLYLACFAVEEVLV